MAQPNLSKAIKELEESVGFPVFRRTSKGVVPTENGKILLKYAAHIMEQLDEIEKIADEIPELQVLGDPSADLLVVSWGGTFGHVYEAVEEVNAKGGKVAMVHFNYINPLPKNAEHILKSYKKVLVCELNEGQLAGYLRMKIDGLHTEKFNRVQGQPFKVEELTECFTKLLEE